MLPWVGVFFLWVNDHDLFLQAHDFSKAAGSYGGGDRVNHASDAVIGGIDATTWYGAYEGHIYVVVYEYLGRPYWHD